MPSFIAISAGVLKTDATNIACGSDGIRATARVNFHDERPSGAGTIARGMDDPSPSNRELPYVVLCLSLGGP